MKRTLLMLAVMAAALGVSAQHSHEPCLTNHVTEEFFKDNTAVAKQLETNYYNGLEQYRQNRPPFQTKSGAKRIIPVVFHVIHTYGPENISKAQIIDQLRVLNEDFNRMNADKTNTRSIFAGDAADCEIEFRLATKDPNGNCTDGINRVYSPLTVETRDEIKTLIRWDNKKYLNIWVVKSIRPLSDDQTGTTLGFAYLPWSLPNTNNVDGVVVRADYIGTTGTSSAAKAGRVLTHEVGHYLGLQHPFNNGCGGSNCSTSGDRVCDTPPVSSPSFGCDKNRNSCSNDNPNQLDMVENFMDYADGSCQNMFTWGQKGVIDYALNNERAQLVSSSNLIATGTDVIVTPTCKPVADFSSVVRTACSGNAVTFADVSWGGPVTTRSWLFPGGTPSISSDSAPNISYANAGTYNVTLTVSNSAGQTQVVRNNVLVVHASIATIKPPFSEGFETATFPPAGWTLTPTATNKNWERTTVSASGGSASIRSVINATTAADEIFTISFPGIDISELSGADNALTFKAAYAQRSGASSDRLRVYYSIDCANSWILLSQKLGSNLTSTSSNFNGTSFVPAANEWREISIPLNSINNGRSNVMFRFEAISMNGNSIYVDDINLYSSTSSAQNYTKENLNFSVYPNPALDASVINLNTPSDAVVDVKVYDITGRLVKDFGAEQKNAGEHFYTISKIDDNLTGGVYFVKVLVDNSLVTEKLVFLK